MNPPRQDEMAIAREAAEWYVALEEGGAGERAAFAQWLLRSQLHVQEFLNQTAIHRMFDAKMDPQRRIEPVSLFREATNNVVALQTPRPWEAGTSRLPRWRWLAAASLAIVAASATWWMLSAGGWEDYRTAVGEQRAVTLQDGSLLHLSAQTHAEVRMDSGQRRVHLLQGQAFFTVRPDRLRPFRVDADATTIEVIGTRFDVNRRTRDTVVAVAEGLVEITAGTGVAERLKAGDQASVGQDGSLQSRGTLDPSGIASWRQRRLHFESTTLEDIAAELNRYNRSPRIRIEGAAIAKRRFSGLLDANQPESLLHLLAETDNLTSERRGDELIVRAH